MFSAIWVSSSEADSKIFELDYVDYFDAVICDAPCSGLGVVNDNPDIKLNRRAEDIVSINLEQISILKTVSKYVKLGGYLYYSTCSILAKENEDILNKLSNYDVKINNKIYIEK